MFTWHIKKRTHKTLCVHNSRYTQCIHVRRLSQAKTIKDIHALLLDLFFVVLLFAVFFFFGGGVFVFFVCLFVCLLVCLFVYLFVCLLFFAAAVGCTCFHSDDTAPAARRVGGTCSTEDSEPCDDPDAHCTTTTFAGARCQCRDGLTVNYETYSCGKRHS